MNELKYELPVMNVTDENSTSKPLSTAVLFLVFNRPDTTEKVFESIRLAKPPRLYIAADGPRMDKAGEVEKVDQVRQIVSNIDWPCEIKTFFREENQGCKLAVSSAIDWFFKNEEMGIILEDDCLPAPTFFMFCQELLEKYKNDQRIGMISGDNFQKNNNQDNYSYYFSKYTHIWGWATWSNRWLNNYDVNINKWPQIRDNGLLESFADDKQEAYYWGSIFEQLFNDKIDTWDYQWVLTNIIEGRINIMPTVNLITNIGFGEDATHTKNDNTFATMEIQELDFPIKHPPYILRNVSADTYTKNTMFYRPLWKRIATKIRNYSVKLNNEKF